MLGLRESEWNKNYTSHIGTVLTNHGLCLLVVYTKVWTQQTHYDVNIHHRLLRYGVIKMTDKQATEWRNLLPPPKQRVHTDTLYENSPTGSIGILYVNFKCIHITKCLFNSKENKLNITTGTKYTYETITKTLCVSVNKKGTPTANTDL